jgi:hypothetical protein
MGCDDDALRARQGDDGQSRAVMTDQTAGDRLASDQTERGPPDELLDRELDHLPPELRWREWMGRVEAVIFAAAEPVATASPRADCRQGLQSRSDDR